MVTFLFRSEILLFVFRSSKKVRGYQFGEKFKTGLRLEIGSKNSPPQAKNMMKSDDESTNFVMLNAKMSRPKRPHIRETGIKRMQS